MDKECNQKGENKISPTLLTPCRPVGLRRKRSSVKITNSPALTLLNATDITSPTSVNAGSIKAQILTDHIAPAEVVQENCRESVVTTNLKHSGNEEPKTNNFKRKSTTPHGCSILRKKIVHRNIHSLPAAHDSSGNEDENEKSSLVESIKVSGSGILKDSDTVGNTGADSSHSPHGSSCISVKGSIDKKFVTTAEINILKERIACKEKKLKELELAALYKKKHNHGQVTKEIECWLQGCKEALNDLQSALAKQDQSYSLVQLLKTLGIPSSLIDIDEDSE